MINKKVTRFPENAIQRSVETFNTPFFLYEEEQIRSNCKQFTETFGKYFENFTPLYAVKANSNPHVVSVIIDEGFGLDCSSPSELMLAKHFNAFGMHTGNYLTSNEIKDVLNAENMLLNLDDISQIEVMKDIAVPEFISFRINPDITKGGMESLMFAGKDAKFGIPWQDALQAYARAKELGVTKFGIHMMTGSNVLEEDYFIKITQKLFQVMTLINKELGIEFEYMNIGGGFGVPYLPTELNLDFEKIAFGLRKTFNEFLERTGMQEPKLMVEPGRSIMADAGFLITNVQAIKNGYSKFVGVDAGMNDLPRPAIYNAYHHISTLNQTESTNTQNISVVGRLCENNDQFAKNRLLPEIEIGSTLIIHNAGAHAFAMGHNYNGRTRSDEYLVQTNNSFKHIRRAETVTDLFKHIVDFDINI